MSFTYRLSLILIFQSHNSQTKTHHVARTHPYLQQSHKIDPEGTIPKFRDQVKGFNMSAECVSGKRPLLRHSYWAYLPHTSTD